MKCKISRKRSVRRRSVSRKRSTKRRRAVSRKRTVSRKRSAHRINRARTTSKCGQYLKSECPSPQCTWARTIGCRKSPNYAYAPVPSIAVLDAEQANAAAAVARARAASGFNAEEFLKKKGCHSYTDKDACPKQSDGMCKWEDSVNKCLPNPEANWGPQQGETKARYEALMKHYQTTTAAPAAPEAAPAAVGQEISQALGMPF